ncbi:NAD-dependent epimerase/dehydratase family protein [Pedobacter sp. GR22-10]|uniref:NAD-dependent epimerase/dehydratase family protein n=1 Tax=Pedobacter sp. GR22-10 TaxID=2994472 RepID=UPI00224836A7|nr:NAD-dependent epimerase/dehydratase family protein [Pedobacter sp. GR22-10]MCX2432367.1 NAD-dependent epimerase/dehydratase family protein [Pedobacter sp. GR22-10]
MIKIAILGANGYIGKHLTYKLIQDESHELFLFDIHPDEDICKNYRQLDLSNPLSDEIRHILVSVDYLFFFSGLTGTIKSVERYEDFIKINELGLLSVLDILKQELKKPKIIFPSTRLVYKGNKNQPLEENAEKEFKTLYAINKYSCENYLAIYKNLFDIDYTIFRICVPYGNMLGNELSYGTLSHFFNKAVKGENITLYGDGSLKRTFTHIDDLTELLIKGAFNEGSSGETYNIGSPDSLSLLEVAGAISNIYDVQVDFTAFPIVDDKIESGDTIFDGSKLEKLLGYNYKHSFKAWIKQFKK